MSSTRRRCWLRRRGWLDLCRARVPHGAAWRRMAPYGAAGRSTSAKMLLHLGLQRKPSRELRSRNLRRRNLRRSLRRQGLLQSALEGGRPCQRGHDSASALFAAQLKLYDSTIRLYAREPDRAPIQEPHATSAVGGGLFGCQSRLR